MYDGPTNSGTLSDREIAGAASAAGFSGNALTIAVAVALAESSGRPGAVNNSNSNGSSDYGLWQINSIHSDLLRNHNWRDPVDNARMAWAISSHGTNWRPWTVYNSGAYRAYLPRARRASGNPAGVPVTDSTGTPSGSSVGEIGSIFKRAALFIAGAVLLIVAVMRMTEVDNVLGKVGLKAATRGIL